MWGMRTSIKLEARGTKGAVAVEFALCLSAFLLLCLGILEFGYDWYVKHLITQASREGARYGVVYRTAADGTRLPPAQLNPSIETVVRGYLSGQAGMEDCSVNVTNNTAYQTGEAGQDLVVRVTCRKTWSVLGTMVPSLNDLTLTGQTVMKCE